MIRQLKRTLRRKAHDFRRIVQCICDYRLYPRCMPVRAYWWTWHPNFGDELTRLILPMYGVAPILRPTDSAELFGVGSILDLVPDGFSGWIWGSGQLHEDDPRSLENATVLAVRGKLTRSLLDLPERTPLGDPGLLVSKRFRRARRSGRIAVVPHFSHRGLVQIQDLMNRLGGRAMLIDVALSPSRVVRQISAADLVVSTSLHGVVVADAYGIPVVWALPEPVPGGGDFKFRDHESVVLAEGVSRSVSLDSLRTESDVKMLARPADSAAVANAQAALVKALSPLLDSGRKRVGPPSLIRWLWHQ